MFLKSLTLKGFKSFAEATTLEMEPGVTVVVGPNGSGKSNVVDAIGWVLGAQAPSAVRSQKMDDVIFAGTAQRPALGRAEVALTIDNTAGLLPVDFTEVTLTRTLFRTGDSEYAINGVPCRLLDMQELLSDSGVGRQQHTIVSQGQIDGVLNARPEDRRLIIEEAAGVLKFRRRREKAERRLAATEANLIRLQDLLREVRRGLRPLEKQADAARRHGDVVAELTTIRTWLVGQELSRLQAQAAEGARRRVELAGIEREGLARLAGLDTEVSRAEHELSAAGGDDLADTVGQLRQLGERARGLAAVLAERQRGVERDRGVAVDRAVVASLEADAARLHAELAEVDQQIALLAPDEERLAEADRRLADARRQYDEQDGQDQPVAAGRAAEVRAELGALRAGLERGDQEQARTESRLAALAQRQDRLGIEADRERQRLADATAEVEALAGGLTVAEAEAGDAELHLTAALSRAREAEGERHRWAARAEALAQALDQTRAGAEHLAGVEGVVGALLDAVEIDPGWDAAVEAAAGEAFTAVVMADTQAGRGGVAALREADLSGTVLTLGGATAPSPPGAGAAAVRPHVRSRRPEVNALLDRLVGDAVLADSWAAALDRAVAEPQRVVVTRQGDRFGPTGWRVGGPGAGATRAAQSEATEQAERAATAAETADGEVAAARHRTEQARRRVAETADRLGQRRGAAQAARAALERIEVGRADNDTEVDQLAGQLAALTGRLHQERATVAEREAALPPLEAEEAEHAERTRALGASRRELEAQMATLGTERGDHQARVAGLDQRRGVLAAKLAEVEQRLERDADQRAQAEARRVELHCRGVAVGRLAAYVAAQSARVDAVLAELQERRRQQSAAARSVLARLEDRRRARSEAERELAEVRERLQRNQMQEAECRIRTEAAVEAVRRDLEIEPEVAMKAVRPELAESVTPSARARELERDLRMMGPINPLALEEYEALQERHQFLTDQLDDVKTSRRELTKVIRAVDTEIVTVFAAAYADVAQNFTALFETLFPGGSGALKLTDPDDLLSTGIEVEARPSGKNVRKLSLLSGGERSLTALAYLFAVFRSRPSPFYVMDEVEAALDDVNLHRFLDLVHEFRAEAQLIVVSHQKRTMEAADCLYGVTMQPGGSSRVVSEKVTAAG